MCVLRPRLLAIASSHDAARVVSAQRVGIVRKLRWGATLKRDAPGAYRLDMTEARFKNSRARTPGPKASTHSFVPTGTECSHPRVRHVQASMAPP